MFKNVGSQKIAVYAFDATTGVPKTGDAANLTAYVSIDWGSVTVLTDTSATEMDSTNAKGMYLFDLTQGETNGNCLIFTGKSSTSNIYLAPQTIYTDPPSFTSFVTPTNLTAAQIATGVWQDTTAGDFTTASSIGKSLYTAGVVPGGTNGLFIAGTNAATTITTALTTTFTGSLTGSVASVTGAVGSVTGAVGSVTGNVGGNVVGSVATVTDLTAAQAEPGQAAPAANASVVTKVAYVYKAWRNKATQTATTYSLFNDDAATVDQKATVSDDATTFTRGEIATGP